MARAVGYAKVPARNFYTFLQGVARRIRARPATGRRVCISSSATGRSALQCPDRLID